MDDRRIADYFVIAGLPENPELLDDTIFNETGHLKGYVSKAPITDIGIVFPTLEEEVPDGFEVLEQTPTGLPADLNHGSIRSPECYICFRRGRDRPPLVDIGVMYDGKERLMADAELVLKSVGGRVANVNNSTARTFISFRRAHPNAPCNSLVVTDICVIVANKGEVQPHAFCKIEKNLNKGLMGSDVFLCYKKSMNRPPLISYKPEVLFRYPYQDRWNIEFPKSVPLFCMPMGASVEMWPLEAIEPRALFSTFVLTVADATDKVYGSALTFYEYVDHETLTPEQMEELGWRQDVSQETHSCHVSKSVCLLSRWPFHDTFDRWLHYILDLYKNKQPLSIPLEKYIVQLLEEIPFPEPRILLQLSWELGAERESTVSVSAREAGALPVSGASYRQLLLNLGPENCLLLLALALTEQKMLLHSLRPDTLTAVAEAVTGLLFPFKWQCPYIPLCPLGLSEVLNAPLPYLIGVDSRFFDLYEPPPDVSCIDLDTNNISLCESQRHITVKLLPKRQARILKQTLEDLYYRIKTNTSGLNSLRIVNGEPTTSLDRDFQKKKREALLEVEIQEAFVRFTASCLKGYRTFLLPITKAPTVGTTDPHALFNMDAFLASRDKNQIKFFTLLMRTQMFTRFIEERSLVCDASLALFDECTERSDREGNLLPPPKWDADRTVLVLPPDALHPGDKYSYDCFELEPSLLVKGSSNCRPVATMTTPASCGGSSASDLDNVARRTSHEVRQAMRLARESWASAGGWAKCLLATVYTLHFISVGQNASALDACTLLERAARLGLVCEEVCYRAALRLCAARSLPALAVRLLFLMRRANLTPNALTYGLYNRCVLEASWPQPGSRLLWGKLRAAVFGAAQFKAAGRRRQQREGMSRVSSSTTFQDSNEDRVSNHRERLPENIVKGARLAAPTHSVAGLLISGHPSNPDLRIPSRRNSFAREDPWAKTCNRSEKAAESRRVLARSESYAGDAKIMHALQQPDKSKIRLPRALSFAEEMSTELKTNINNNTEVIKISTTASPLKPVLSDDPLGALSPEPAAEPPKKEAPSTPQRAPPPLSPKLFRDREFHDNDSKLHRSETAPAGSVASSLVSLGNSLRFSFGAGSLAGKKSNEFLQSGLSSLKSAATTVVKKIDEMKDVISANSTPVKGALGNATTALTNLITEEDSTDDSDSNFTEGVGRSWSRRGSWSSSWSPPADVYPEKPPPPPSQTPHTTVRMWSKSICNRCSATLYDDDIMAGWAPDESNLNTKCPACGHQTVPVLSAQVESSGQSNTETLSVPYLNPLVLRKELESIINNEGDICLIDPKFVELHPIVYWNLVWYMERANIPSHFALLCSKEKSSGDSNNITRVVCYWEAPGARDPSSDSAAPLYALWRTPDSRAVRALLLTDHSHTQVTQSVINGLRNNELTDALQKLAAWRQGTSPNNKYPSLYRDVLFLATAALGSGNIDAWALQREYSRALTRLGAAARALDCPPGPPALAARLFFRPLQLPR